MTRLILPIVVCLVVAVVGDSSAQGDTQVAETPSGDVSQHSLVKREAKDGGKRKGSGKAQRKINKPGRKRGRAPRKMEKKKGGRGRARGRSKVEKKKKRKKTKPNKKGSKRRRTRKRTARARNNRKEKGKRTGKRTARRKNKGKGKRKRTRKRTSRGNIMKNRRRQQRGNLNTVRKQRQNETQTSINYTECAMKMKEFASRIKKAGNLERQSKRITDFKKINDNKKGKKGNFNSTLLTLTTALGGNTSSPQCRTVGVNYTEQLDTLSNCMKNIESNCTLEMNSNDTTEIKACEEAGKALFKEVDDCIKPAKSLEDSCTCFAALTNDNLDIVKSCNISGKNAAAKDAKKICTSGFSACKKAEAAVVNIVDQCKPQKKCGGAGDKEEAEKQLQILRPLSDALNNRGFENGLTAAGLAGGTGSDGVLPDTRRLARQTTEGAACTAILNDWKSFNTSADKAVPGVEGELDGVETNNTINTLNKLNNNENLDADLASCKKEARQGTATFVIIEIRFYVFWCGWFRFNVVEIRITIIVGTFFPGSLSTTTTTTTSTTDGTAASSSPGSVSTPGGRNRQILHLRRHLLK